MTARPPFPLQSFLDVWPGGPVQVPTLQAATYQPEPPGLLVFEHPFRYLVELPPSNSICVSCSTWYFDEDEQLRDFLGTVPLLATPGFKKITPRDREADRTALAAGPRKKEHLRELWAE